MVSELVAYIPLVEMYLLNPITWPLPQVLKWIKTVKLFQQCSNFEKTEPGPSGTRIEIDFLVAPSQISPVSTVKKKTSNIGNKPTRSAIILDCDSTILKSLIKRTEHIEEDPEYSFWSEKCSEDQRSEDWVQLFTCELWVHAACGGGDYCKNSK